MRNIKSIFIGLIIALTILLAFTISVSIIFEDEVSQYLVEELNEYLLSEIEVGEINFTVLKKFPKATLEFKDVIAFTKKGYEGEIRGINTDTLFYAGNIYVQMSLANVFSKNYNISSLSFDQGKINLFTDKYGNPNYIFWKKKSEEQNKNFSLDLNEVKIINSEIVYCNDATDLLFITHADRIDFEGNFSRQNYLMKIKSGLTIRELSVKNTKYLENKKVKTKIELDIINDLINIKHGSLVLQNLKFDVNGNIEKSESAKTDLLISGKNMHLPSFINNLPAKIKNEFPAISFQDGSITLSLNISGENNRTVLPHIDALFLVSDAQLFDEKRQVRFSKINIDGEFNNGELNNLSNSEIVLKSFSSLLENNSFKGTFKLKNLVNPLIELNMDTELIFSEIKDVFEIDTLEIFEGKATAKIVYNGSYYELKEFKFSDLFTKDYKINLRVDDGEFKIKGKAVQLTKISGNVNLQNSLYADSIYFEIGENDFLINGRVSKLFEYFEDREIFNINAKLFSQKINLNELAPLFEADNAIEEETSYRFPDKLSMQLKLNIRNFEVGKFNATSIKGNMNYKPGMFSMHEIAFNSMNGKVKAGGVILQKQNNNFTVKTQCRLNNININNLFYSFNNFGQSFITNKNIDGTLSGDVFFTSDWSDKIEVNKSSVSSDCDILILNGELNDFEPMMGLSRFIDVDELKNIKFSELKNKITIQEETITIPKMEIKSSAINLTASGEHRFDKNYLYHIKVLLSDLISGKRKRSKKKKQDSEISNEDTEGRITLFLSLEGDSDDTKIRYDRKTARADRKESMKDEKNELKEILNDEFGWYEKDTTINQNPDNQKSNNSFEIEFEETDQKDKKKKKSDSDEKFVIEWEEDSTNINMK
ncbi:MAG: AsmA-like C-terminal region-containing protein [Bacteroidales bacterium]|nr:AsmA-like C-terminal region-containing protein [Bacteroidales bacterium]